MLSTTAEYALRIMVTLAEADGRALTSEAIADHTCVPADYAVKILQWLGREGYVRSQRGRGGGFVIARDPGRTTLLEIVNVIDPLQRITSCPLGRPAHQHRLCPLHKQLDDVLKQLEDGLRSMTLENITERAGGSALCSDQAIALNVSAKK